MGVSLRRERERTLDFNTPPLSAQRNATKRWTRTPSNKWDNNNTTNMPRTQPRQWTSWEPVTSIANASDFVQFARSVKHLDGYCGLTVLVERNVDMNGVPFEPIDGFCGTLDGQGHKVSNLLRSISSSRNHVGPFGLCVGEAPL